MSLFYVSYDSHLSYHYGHDLLHDYVIHHDHDRESDLLHLHHVYDGDHITQPGPYVLSSTMICNLLKLSCLPKLPILFYHLMSLYLQSLLHQYHHLILCQTLLLFHL